jgi:hypothetical protein
MLIVGVLIQSADPVPDAPRATVANDVIRATVTLPDAQKGYYRGTRFDWGGSIESLTWGGHEYFGQWFDRYEATIHDAITGPVEEFVNGDEKTGYDAVGYRDAAPGGTFVRIGIGVLRKPAGETALQRFGKYEIVDGGRWTAHPGKDRVEFIHELDDKAGHAYRYRKLLRLDRGTLVLEHELTNTGTKPLPTQVYNHNFFTLDRKTTGPDVVVRFPFAPKAARPLEGKAEIRGREIAFLRELQSKESVFSELEGFGPTPADYHFEIENRASGAGVRITGDHPLAKLYFWSHPKTVCPEPYIDVSVEPGKTSRWRITYEFYQAKK